MKVCPTCKSRCFDDMDTCYGCLHNFEGDEIEDVFAYPEKEEAMQQNQKITVNAENSAGPEATQILRSQKIDHEQKILKNQQIPEYFELDTFPYIEEDDLVPVEVLDSTQRLNNSGQLNENVLDNAGQSLKISLQIPWTLIEDQLKR